MPRMQGSSTQAIPSDIMSFSLMEDLITLNKLLNTLRGNIAETNKMIADNKTKIATPKRKAKPGQSNSATTTTNDLAASVKELESVATATEAFISAVTTKASNGYSPLDLAIQGEVIRDAVDASCLYTLSLDVVASDVDVVAQDGLLRGLRLSTSQTTVVSWMLVDERGRIASTGVSKNDSHEKGYSAKVNYVGSRFTSNLLRRCI
jgi:hypothetical protein